MVALAAGKDAFSDYSHLFSPHKFTQPQLFACLVLKEFEKKDYRGICGLLRDCPELCEIIGLKLVPHFTTLQKASRRLLKQAHVRRLIDHTVRKIRRRKTRVPYAAVDSSGFDAHHASRYFIWRRDNQPTNEKTAEKAAQLQAVRQVDAHHRLRHARDSGGRRQRRAHAQCRRTGGCIAGVASFSKGQAHGRRCRLRLGAQPSSPARGSRHPLDDPTRDRATDPDPRCSAKRSISKTDENALQHQGVSETSAGRNGLFDAEAEFGLGVACPEPLGPVPRPVPESPDPQYRSRVTTGFLQSRTLVLISVAQRVCFSSLSYSSSSASTGHAASTPAPAAWRSSGSTAPFHTAARASGSVVPSPAPANRVAH
jgi:hypothetical protein